MRKIFWLIIVLLFAFPVFADDMTEQEKISDLLDAFTTSEVTLVRDGQQMDGLAARDHFEQKMKEVQGVNTADDFIDKVASNTRKTGKPYTVKLKDGTQMESAKWLHEQLKEIENTPTIE